MQDLETLRGVEDREGHAQLRRDPDEEVLVGVAYEGVVPVNYLLDHIQLVVMVTGGGMVAPPTQREGMV